jgi:hypothetical protein
VGQSPRKNSIFPALLAIVKPDTVATIKTVVKKTPPPTTLCECVDVPWFHYHLVCPVCSAQWKMRAKHDA